MLSRWSRHPCGSQHQTVLPEYSDFTEAVNYLRSRKLNSMQRVKYRQDIAAAKRGGTLKVECAGRLSLRVWSLVSRVGKSEAHRRLPQLVTLTLSSQTRLC